MLKTGVACACEGPRAPVLQCPDFHDAVCCANATAPAINALQAKEDPLHRGQCVSGVVGGAASLCPNTVIRFLARDTKRFNGSKHTAPWVLHALSRVCSTLRKMFF